MAEVIGNVLIVYPGDASIGHSRLPCQRVTMAFVPMATAKEPHFKMLLAALSGMTDKIFFYDDIWEALKKMGFQSPLPESSNG